MARGLVDIEETRNRHSSPGRRGLLEEVIASDPRAAVRLTGARRPRSSLESFRGEDVKQSILDVTKPRNFLLGYVHIRVLVFLVHVGVGTCKGFIELSLVPERTSPDFKLQASERRWWRAARRPTIP